jgi:hypothetical protein
MVGPPVPFGQVQEMWYPWYQTSSPVEFRAPEEGVAELVLGAKATVFEKLAKLGQHMKSLFVTGYKEGRPIQKIMIDGGGGQG